MSGHPNPGLARFQFLGIPPKGEHDLSLDVYGSALNCVSNF